MFGILLTTLDLNVNEWKPKADKQIELCHESKHTTADYQLRIGKFVARIATAEECSLVGKLSGILFHSRKRRAKRLT